VKEQSYTMNWIYWSLLSAAFAGATAVLAKVGIAGVDSNLATAIRTSVILVFTWVIAYATSQPGAARNLTSRTWIFRLSARIRTSGHFRRLS
jgi:bacterial/archaeal transporter family protein